MPSFCYSCYRCGCTFCWDYFRRVPEGIEIEVRIEREVEVDYTGELIEIVRDEEEEEGDGGRGDEREGGDNEEEQELENEGGGGNSRRRRLRASLDQNSHDPEEGLGLGSERTPLLRCNSTTTNNSHAAAASPSSSSSESTNDFDLHTIQTRARDHQRYYLNLNLTPTQPELQAPTLEGNRTLNRRVTMASLPRSDYDPRRVCLNPFPNFTLGKHKRTIGVYLSGILFALANWIFLDAAILSAHAKPTWDDEAPIHVTFVDWVPGICSLLGYFVIVLIDKDRVRGDEGSFGDSRAVWRARFFLFIGFALMAGGLAGSVALLILKYVLPGYTPQFTYYGYAVVSQSVALMLSSMVLWIAQHTSNEYEYNLTL